MSNEKQNNSWKGKLDELEQHPDASFSKAAAWEQLYERLEEKPRRNKGVWYVAAAACLLLVAIASWKVLHTKTNDQLVVEKTSAPVTPVTATTNTPGTDTTVSQQSFIVKPIDPASIKTEPVVIGKTAKERNTPTYLSSTHKKSYPILPVAVPVASQTTTTVTAIPALPPASLLTVVTAPPKKKLKVVHINELDDSMEDEIKMAKSANWHYFQVKLNSRDPFAEPVPETPQRTNDIKIKLPPQN